MLSSLCLYLILFWNISF